MEAHGTRWRIEELLGESSWLSALATALVADRGLAQDVVQDTWAAALRSPPERGTPVRPWLARVARNFARQRLRGDARRQRRERERVLEREQAGPDVMAARLEGQRLLVEAIGELDEPYRSTVLWIYFEHRTAAEVAALAGVAPSTVRWR
jgi:RNA polymerase sigma factor (sigma-70 family)